MGNFYYRNWSFSFRVCRWDTRSISCWGWCGV